MIGDRDILPDDRTGIWIEDPEGVPMPGHQIDRPVPVDISEGARVEHVVHEALFPEDRTVATVEGHHRPLPFPFPRQEGKEGVLYPVEVDVEKERGGAHLALGRSLPQHLARAQEGPSRGGLDEEIP